MVRVDRFRNEQTENAHVNNSGNQACACYSCETWEHECCIYHKKFGWDVDMSYLLKVHNARMEN